MAQAAVHEPLPAMWKDIARRTGIAADNHSMTLAERAGDLGDAHALFALGLALQAANPGDHVLAAGTGSGWGALVFRVASSIPSVGRAEARRVGDRWGRQ